MTPTLIPTFPPVALPSAPTVDTLISSLSTFSSFLIGILTLFLIVVGALGGFLVWNGFEMRRKAEKDLQKIEDTKDEAVKMFGELQTVAANFKKFADETIQKGNETVRLLTETLSTAEAKTRAEKAIKEWDKKFADYSNTSQGTAPLFEAPRTLRVMTADDVKVSDNR